MTEKWKNMNEIYLLLLDSNIIINLTIPLVGFLIDYWENKRQLKRTQVGFQMKWNYFNNIYVLILFPTI